MYRVILADDEKWSIYGLMKLIRWEDFDCEIIGTAEDGLTALRLCRELRPDLLITDIRMPGMDGLELARALAMELPEVTTIMVTGYSDLSYAQRAVRLGVFDYLLKQISASELETSVKRFVAHAKELSRRSLSGLYFSLFDDGNTGTVRECMDTLCIDVPELPVRAVSFLFNRPIDCQSVMVEEIDGGATAVVFHTGSNALTCYLFSDRDAEQAAKNCSAVLPEGVTSVGMGEMTKSDSSFFELYRQSRAAAASAQFWNLSGPYVYRKIGTELTEPLFETMRRQLTENARSDAEKTFEKLLIQLEGLPIDICAQALNRASALSGAFHLVQLDDLFPVDLEQYAIAGGKASELFSVLQEAIQNENPATEEGQVVISQILEYIDQNYRRDLRITELAEKYYMNASYLSTLIRKRTGKTYSMIVTEKRIACASRLLRDTTLSVQEVAYRSGYHEYSHFNRLFKSITGKTPAQYRAECK